MTTGTIDATAHNTSVVSADRLRGLIAGDEDPLARYNANEQFYRVQVTIEGKTYNLVVLGINRQNGFTVTAVLQFVRNCTAGQERVFDLRPVTDPKLLQMAEQAAQASSVIHRPIR